MKKRILALFFALCLCVPAYVQAAGEENAALPSNNDGELMRTVVSQSTGVDIEITDMYYILDVSGNPTMRCVEFEHSGGTKGFGVIDLASFTVTMFAMDAAPGFDAQDTVVYNGFLRFAVVDELSGTAMVLGDEQALGEEELFNDSRDNLTVKSENEKAAIIGQMSLNTISTYQTLDTAPIVVEGAGDEDLVYNAGDTDGAWNTDCGINAAAMYLQHMDNYFNDNYITAAYDSEATLKVALAILANDNLQQTVSLTSTNLVTIINAFIDSYSGSGVSGVYHVGYTWLRYKNLISEGSGTPCILRLDAGTTDYFTGAHFVIGVGYSSGATASSGYLYVNSGWEMYDYVYVPTTAATNIVRI